MEFDVITSEILHTIGRIWVATFSPVVASGARPVAHLLSPMHNVWRLYKKERNSI